MFCPDGYYGWNDLLEMSNYWAETIIEAKRYEAEGKDPAIAFSEPLDPNSELSADSTRNHERWIENDKEREFATGIISCCLLAKVLLEYEPLFCSSEGNLMRAPSFALFHKDRLDWCYWNWPIRETTEFSNFFKYFDAGKFDTKDIFDRFCCIDAMTGLVSIKNDTIKSLDSASHIWTREGDIEKIVKGAIAPYVGWSLVWKPSIFPDEMIDVLDSLGVAEKTWEGAIAAFVKVKTGRPKYEKAFAEFEKMNFDKGDYSWKELIILIGQKVDEWPKEPTYRNWVNQNRERFSETD